MAKKSDINNYLFLFIRNQDKYLYWHEDEAFHYIFYNNHEPQNVLSFITHILNLLKERSCSRVSMCHACKSNLKMLHIIICLIQSQEDHATFNDNQQPGTWLRYTN